MSAARGILVCLCCLLSSIPTASHAATSPPLRYAGATTLQRYFMPEAARAFAAATGVYCAIEGGNTDAGLKALLGGRIDMAGAGRFLTPSEKAAGLREHLLGWDVLTVIVHQSNPVTNLSRSQLRGILAGQIRNWQEVGGRDQPILIIAAPEGSGMRSTLQQLVLDETPLCKTAVTALVVADIDQQVAQWPGAIGAVSHSMLDAAGTKSLSIDGIAPESSQILAKRYPLTKPLLLVTRRDAPGGVTDFAAFAKGPEGQRLLRKYFVPIQPQ